MDFPQETYCIDQHNTNEYDHVSDPQSEGTDQKAQVSRQRHNSLQAACSCCLQVNSQSDQAG